MALYLPERYLDLKETDCGVRVFADRDLDSSDSVARYVTRGGLAVLQGPWERVLGLRDTLKRRLDRPGALRRLMVRAEGDWIHSVVPAQYVPDLAMVVGETGGAAGTFLVALEDFLKAQAALETLHPVDALGGNVVAHENVLAPRSQPLIHLLKLALAEAAPGLPAAPTVLDMGCGSGVCALLAARTLPGASVVATDHLPEAVASTRLNIRRFEADCLIEPGRVSAAEPGDLYETLGGHRFDLIIFNAPWVSAPARNRMETALNDAGQRTVGRFLTGAPAHLKPGGSVILGFADHSGPKALANVERLAAEAGLALARRHADRIKTHRSSRAWQAIFAYHFLVA